jgi:hypothetical protein
MAGVQRGLRVCTADVCCAACTHADFPAAFSITTDTIMLIAGPLISVSNGCLSRKRVADWPRLPWASRVAEAIWRLPEVHKVPSCVARGSEIHGSRARAA